MLKVIAVNHRYRRFMRKVFVGAIVWWLMLSASVGARAEDSAPAVQAGSGQAQVTHDETGGPAQQAESDEAGAPVEQGESNPAPPTSVSSGLTPRAESTPSPEAGLPLTSAAATSGTATSAPATSAPATSGPATTGQATSEQAAGVQPASGVPDEVSFLEDEWVTYLNLPADQEAALKRALAVKHRHKSELAEIPGVWLVWVDADKDQPPIIRLDVKEETPVEIDRIAPLEVEGVPVEEVKTHQWFLMAPLYAAPTNFSEGAPHGQLSPNATQAAGQSGTSNLRTNAGVSLSGWSKIGPVDSERNCERSKAFLIWLATDPRFVAHYKQIIQQQRGAKWSYDQSKMAEKYRDGICVAGSDPRLAGK
jgi:hypothetical protein